MNELINILNEDGTVLNSKSKDEIHRLGLLHREVHLWLFDKDYNVYFSKSAAKKSFAGLLDASVGGHVDAGEECLSTAVREVKEESGLFVSPTDLFFLTKFKGVSENKKEGIINNFIRFVYIYKNPVSEKQLTADPSENDGFQKFPFDFLSNLNEENTLLFHKFVPTHELPHVLNYLKNLRGF